MDYFKRINKYRSKNMFCAFKFAQHQLRLASRFKHESGQRQMKTLRN